jgi:YbbR domain-containing protein
MNEHQERVTPTVTPKRRASSNRVGWLRAALFEDLGLKSVALLLSIAFWASLQLRQEVRETVEMQVAFRAPEGQMVVGELERTVQVTLGGSQAAVDGFKALASGEPVSLSTASYGVGTTSVYLNTDLLELPRNLRAEAIRPSVVLVVVARRKTRQVPVTAVVTGKPASGMIALPAEVVPQQVTVEGPEDLVDGLDGVHTEAIDLAGATRTISRKLRLITGRAQVQVVDLSEVRVRVAIEAPVATVTVRGIRVRPAEHWVSAQPTVDVTLRGDRQSLARLTAQDLVAELVLDSVIHKGGKRFVRTRIVGLPQGVLRASAPSMVTIERAKKKNGQKGE